MRMGQTRQAGAYLRISDDRLGDEAGVERQERDCRKLAEVLGWEVAIVYIENDTSAFKRRKIHLPDGTVALRVLRPQFRRMLDDLASGAINAVVGYDLDRVARDPRDLEDLIDVVEQNHIPTRAVTGSLDLSTDSGVTMARVMVAVANKSSRDTARRVTRKHADLAEQGRVGGGGVRAYGYEPDGMTVREHEAEVIREIAARVLDGQSLRSIAKVLTARGEPTVRGNTVWAQKSVQDIVRKPRNAGLRTYHGRVVGDAAWPPVLDRETWERVCLAMEARGKGGKTTLKRWLNGVLFCSRCQHELRGWCQAPAHGGRSSRRYWCPSSYPYHGCGGIAIDAERAEARVEALILAYLTRPDVIKALSRTFTSDSADRARVEIAEDEQQLKDLAAASGRREITMAEYLAARRPVAERLAQRRDLLASQTPQSVRRLIKAGDMPKAWKAMSPTQRREVARAVFPHGLEVLPATRRSVFDPTRLRERESQ